MPDVSVARERTAYCRLRGRDQQSVAIVEQTAKHPKPFLGSVLMLFEYYPGDAVLQAYLKEAIQSRLISLPTFTATFLLAARSRALRDPVTLSLLCKTIQEAHVWLDPSAAPATLLPTRWNY